MWVSMGNNIKMAEGDYGIGLDFTVDGEELSAEDSAKFTFKNSINGTTILEKDVAIIDNVITLEFTAAESALFTIGQYVYALDWYKNGEFMCNLILAGVLTVGDKA